MLLPDSYPHDCIEAFTKLHFIENKEFVLPAQYHLLGLGHHMELIMSEADKDTPFLEILKLLCVQLGTGLLWLSTGENQSIEQIYSDLRHRKDNWRNKASPPPP